jgi:glycosyltransferase involved in cell wall biosynthesis
MNILFWVPYPTEGASNRYRVEQYLPYLEDARVTYRLHPFWTGEGYEILYKPGNVLKKMSHFMVGTISRIKDLFLMWRYDVVFIHREAYPVGGAFFERALKLFGKPVVFDFDDAIFLPAISYQNSFARVLKQPEKIKGIVKNSSFVIAGNDYLADFAIKFNSKVKVIPTSVDTDKFRPVIKKTPTEEITIGWIGSGTTIGFVKTLKNAIIRLDEKYDNIVFKVVGGNLSDKDLHNIINKPWSLSEEIDDINSFDIGIMPMDDNDWTRGKCGFKAILYMSMGIPSVCSPVGVNNEIVSDGVNGFLADSEDEWVEKLSRLIEDKDLRSRMGALGRKTIEEKYSVKVNAPKFLDVIKQVYQGKAAG